MNFKHIAVAGSGVLGSQIAYQTAFKGFQVSVYDINDQALFRLLFRRLASGRGRGRLF